MEQLEAHGDDELELENILRLSERGTAMRDLYDHWTADIPDEYSRGESDEGFTTFRKSDVEVSAILYGGYPFSVSEAIDTWCDSIDTMGSRVLFHLSRHEPTGMAMLTNDGARPALETALAIPGRVLVVTFLLGGEIGLDDAITIWKTIQYNPPLWVRRCEESPALLGLRDALQVGTGVSEAVTSALKTHAHCQVVNILREALRDDCTTVLRSACRAISCADYLTAEVAEALDGLLTGGDILVRASAAETLWDYGAPPSAIIPALVAALRQEESPLPYGEARVEGVCNCLRIPSRYFVLEVLRRMGPEAVVAKDVVERFKWDESGPVRLSVADTLLTMGYDFQLVSEPLVAAISDKRFSRREQEDIADWLVRHERDDFSKDDNW